MSAVTRKDLSTISERMICFRSESEMLIRFSEAAWADCSGRRDAVAAEAERKDRRESRMGFVVSF